MSGTTPSDPFDAAVDEAISSAAKTIWWLVLIRGVLAIVFGVLALVAPAAALAGIALVFGVYAIVDGVTEIGHAIRLRGAHRRWGWLLAQGIISILAGLAAVIFPGLAGFFGGVFALWLIAFYAIMLGVAGFPAAAAIDDTARKALGYVAAVLSLLLGIGLIFAIAFTPGATVLSLVWIVGIYAIVFGVVLIAIAIAARVRVSRAARTA